MEEVNEEVNEVNEVIEERVNENVVNNNEEFTNSLQKPKKPRTEKQIEALKKAQIKRKENFEKRKKEKQTTQEFITNHENELKEKALQNTKPKPKKKTTKVIYQEPSDSESSEEEIIYIKPKKKVKKKKKKVVIQQSSSESESSSEEEESGGANFIYEQATPKPRRALKYSDVFRFS